MREGKLVKRVLLCLLVVCVLLFGGFAVCAYIVQQAGKGRVYDLATTIPPREVGLVLGTSEHRRDGGG